MYTTNIEFINNINIYILEVYVHLYIIALAAR